MNTRLRAGVYLALLMAVMVAAFTYLPAHAQGPERFQSKSITHAPVANTKATISAAAVTNQRNVAECVSATFAAGTAAPTAVNVEVDLRDGATGAGTVLHSWRMSLPATAGASNAPIQLCGLNVFGTAGTAMTIEFSAAGGANTFESVGLTYHVE